MGTVMMTNAPTIYHLENTFYQIGGSISGIPVPFWEASRLEPILILFLIQREGTVMASL